MGIGQAPVDSGAAQTLYPPTKNLGLFHLLRSPLRSAGAQLLAVRAISAKTRKDTPYLAETYQIDLVDFAHQNAVIYAWGVRPFSEYMSAQFAVTVKDQVFVHDKGWLLLTPLRSAPFCQDGHRVLRPMEPRQQAGG